MNVNDQLCLIILEVVSNPQDFIVGHLVEIESSWLVFDYPMLKHEVGINFRESGKIVLYFSPEGLYTIPAPLSCEVLSDQPSPDADKKRLPLRRCVVELTEDLSVAKPPMQAGSRGSTSKSPFRDAVLRHNA